MSTSSGGNFSKKTKWDVWRKAHPYGAGFSEKNDAYRTRIKWGAYGSTSSKYGWEIDHIVPLAKGGSDDLSNLQALQWKNNRKKTDR